MAINLNTQPYYDDFDGKKNFHQILFKPGMAVQARELTQLQTILQNQISRFGNHMFKNGTVVIPGNSFSEIGVNYIDVSTVAAKELFESKTIVGQVTGVKATVKHAVYTTSGTIRLFIGYTSGGNNNESVFLVEPITVEYDPGVSATIIANSAGIGSLAHVNEGVYYINGKFVLTASQTTVMSYDLVPSCKVVLVVSEEIVNSSQDQTLLDPAQGSYNFAAPGADRVKIALTLKSFSLDEDTSSSEDFIELMRYREGALEMHNRNTKYSELEKGLARRTYDESGDYIVNGFSYKVVDNFKSTYNDGVSFTGDRDSYSIKIDAGKAYIKGYEVETLSQNIVTAKKGRSADHIKSDYLEVKKTYGNYIFVTDIKKLPNSTQKELITFYNDNDPNNASAVAVGTARVLGIDFVNEGVVDNDRSIYKLYITDVSMNAKPSGGSYSMTDIGGYRFGVGGSATVLHKYSAPNAVGNFVGAEGSPDVLLTSDSNRTATVHMFDRSTGVLYAYKHDHEKDLPVAGDYVASGTKNVTLTSITSMIVRHELPFVEMPSSVIASTKTPVDLVDTEYRTWLYLSLALDGSGNGSHTLPTGTFVQLENGTIAAFGPAGIVSSTKLSLGSPSTLVVTGGPASTTIDVICQIERVNVPAKTKTLTTTTISGVTPTSTINLDKTDIYSIVSIVSNNTDVTEAYRLDNGQRDFYYDVGRLVLIGQLPTAPLTITFQYFEHSGSGDYFSVDSYTTLKSSPTSSDHIEKIPSYVSRNTGKTYSLASVLDFRPTVSSMGAFNSITSNPLVDDSFVRSSFKYYVARFDCLYINKAGELKLALGIPNKSPKIPSIPGDSLEIAKILIPPYTFRVEDITSKFSDNVRFTMKDIKKISDRVGDLEVFSTLNALESQSLSTEILDAETGLNRFKNGYLVDTFANPFEIADTFAPGFYASNSNFRMSAVEEPFESYLGFEVDSNNYMQYGDCVSLPFIEVAMAEQPYSSRKTPINPFRVFSWQGNLNLTPSKETWCDIVNLDTKYNSKTETVKVYIDPPPTPAPKVPTMPTPNPVPPSPAPTVPPVVTPKATHVSIPFVPNAAVAKNSTTTSNRASVNFPDAGTWEVELAASGTAGKMPSVDIRVGPNVTAITTVKGTVSVSAAGAGSVEVTAPTAAAGSSGSVHVTLFNSAHGGKGAGGTVFTGTFSWTVQADTVVVTPPPAETYVTVTYFLRDLGYIQADDYNASNPLWNERVSFQVPTNVYNAAMNTLNAIKDPIAKFNKDIELTHNYFQSYADKGSVLSKYAGMPGFRSSPYSAAEIQNYWKNEGYSWIK